MTDLSGLVIFRNSANGAAGSGADEQERWPDCRSVDYLQARERAERAAAKRAQSAAARHVHQELAQHYAELARQSG